MAFVSPWCIAHRGDRHTQPENTHAAFEAALTHPIDGIELDVRITADNHIVVFHDVTSACVGGGDRFIANHTLAQLQTLDYGEGEPLPLLDEVLTRYGQRTHLLLEVKTGDGSESLEQQHHLMLQTIEAIHRYGLEDRTMVLCYDLALLAHGHHAYRQVRCVLNQDEGKLVDASFLYGYSVDVGGLTPAFVAAAHQAGKPVYCFTCNSQAQVDHALACGVDGIMADHPAELARRLRSGHC